MREFLIFRDVFLGKSLFRAADADLFAVLRGGAQRIHTLIVFVHSSDSCIFSRWGQKTLEGGAKHRSKSPTQKYSFIIIGPSLLP